MTNILHEAKPQNAFEALILGITKGVGDRQHPTPLQWEMMKEAVEAHFTARAKHEAEKVAA